MFLVYRHLQTLMRAFGRLQQRILMKWNEDHIDGLSSNVRLAKWLPQQDILGTSRWWLPVPYIAMKAIET